MSAANVDLLVDQGEDWTTQIYWTDFYDDPQKVTAPMRMSIRSQYGQEVASLYTPDVAWPAGEIPPISYSTETGWIQLHIPSVTTNTIPPGNYMYDLFVSIDDGAAYAGVQEVRLLAGQVYVHKRITPST